MQVEMQYVDNVDEKLNLSRDEIIRESLKFYLEKIIREIKTDIFKIRTKYGVSSIEEFEEKYKKGEIEEKDSWQGIFSAFLTGSSVYPRTASVRKATRKNDRIP